MKNSVMGKLSLLERRKLQRDSVSGQKKHWLRLNNACNNNCVFCLDSDCQDGISRDMAAITKDLRMGISRQAKKVVLSGGDPTIHPDFIEIARLAVKTGYSSVQAITNGRMFCYAGFLREAVDCGLTEVTFSFHGHTRKLYEKHSGVKGSYEQAMAGLCNALRLKPLIVNIDVVINRMNYRFLEDIIRFFIGLGVNEFDLLQVMPFGRAWKNRDKVLYDTGKALPYLKKAFDLQNEFPGVYIWTNRLPAQYLEGYEELIQHPAKLFDEIRGREYLFDRFAENGQMMSCFGSRCRYCFLRMFCRDLIELKKKKIIAGRATAFCISPVGQPGEFRAGGCIDIYQFLDFYIKERYFLKSLRCRGCRYSRKCHGAPIELVRQKGFGILNEPKDNK